MSLGISISEEQRRIKALEREVQQLKMEKDILKKATALLMSDSMNGLLIEKIKESYSVKALCRVFNIQRSSYHIGRKII